MDIHRHGNKISPSGNHNNRPTRLCKVSADSVPYGPEIATRGNSVWVAYEGAQLIAVAATSDEALAKYREWKRKRK